jgi:DNA-binding LacI/PurR family transcriptional regulator
VSEATRRRVTRAIRRLQYRPNALARGLVTRRSHSIGLVIADVVNPFFPPLVRGVEDAAAARGYNVILCDTDEDPARERAVISILLQKQVDGLILCASRTPTSFLKGLADGGVPLVLVNRVLAHRRAAAVVLDGAEGGRRATAHLLSLGHRRIAYLAGPVASFSHRTRLQGYREALVAQRVSFDPALVTGGGVASIALGREAMAALLALTRPPTGVVAFDDLMAIGALEALRQRGARVPEDVAVVGFDDIDLAAYLDPPLTSVAQPKNEMGKLATNRLLDMVEAAAPPRPRVITLTPELVIRRSCGAYLAVADTSPLEAAR